VSRNSTGAERALTELAELAPHAPELVAVVDDHIAKLRGEAAEWRRKAREAGALPKADTDAGKLAAIRSLLEVPTRPGGTQ
jgi:hypothetical protein